MGHNNVVSGHPKSTGISRVDGLSTGPPDLGCHNRRRRYYPLNLPFIGKWPIKIVNLGNVGTRVN